MTASVARRRVGRFAAAGMVALVAALTPGPQAVAEPDFTVIADGLDNPRGLAFGPDGALYVAEAGLGGSAPCLEGPEGNQVCFGLTGAVTRIKGGQSRVLTGLPSLAEAGGEAATGPSDVSFLGIGFLTVGLGADPADRNDLPPSGRTLGQVLSFAPGSPRAVSLANVAGHDASGHPDGGLLNGLVNVNPQAVQGGHSDTPRTGVDSLARAGLDTNHAIDAQLLRLGRALGHLPACTPRVPLAVPLADGAGPEASNNPDGGAIDSNPQAVQAGLRGAAVTDAGGNSLVRMGFDRRIETLAVFPPRMVDAPPFLELPPGTQIPMESVPTGVVARGGGYFVSELTGFPFQVGAARVHRVVPGQEPEVYATGLTNAIDLDFSVDGTLYVLEIEHEGLLAEGSESSGALVKVEPGEDPAVVLDGLESPTGLTIRDGNAYITDCGTCAGKGRVLRLPL